MFHLWLKSSQTGAGYSSYSTRSQEFHTPPSSFGPGFSFVMMSSYTTIMHDETGKPAFPASQPGEGTGPEILKLLFIL